MFACDGGKIYHGDTSFIDLAKRQLMINKITYPASSMSRAFRYYEKGFRMCAGEMKKLVMAIQEMPKIEQNTEENDTLGATPVTTSGNSDPFWRAID